MTELLMRESRFISDQQFKQIRDWLYERSGIHLNATKKSLVTGRLYKRLTELDLADFDAYLQLLRNPLQSKEAELALNLLTTNETYFFREPKHFDFLHSLIAQGELNKRVRVWSAAASTGEEAFSIALALASQFGLQEPWQVIGTDINTRVLQQARSAVYPLPDSQKIDPALLKAFCVKGVGKDEGWFRIRPQVRQHVQFQQHNLMQPLLVAQKFDLIFLRNVLIYFELEDKKRIVLNMLEALKPGGFLLVGHSESIHGYDPRLVQQRPACYRYMP
ncbi:protein-glutamate O-methyltransferase CheR [Rheinheimera texasensis]|uniref:CheR family methyltransferase n=1 Tax=Rheinheimera texasensis TaxID=306205 RepID=UPI0032B16455